MNDRLIAMEKEIERKAAEEKQRIAEEAAENKRIKEYETLFKNGDFEKSLDFAEKIIHPPQSSQTQKTILEAIIANILEKIGNISSQLEFKKSIELMKSLLLSNTPHFDEKGVYSLQITENNNLDKIQ